MLAVLSVLTIASSYIFLDTALTVTTFFQSTNPAKLHNDWVFILTIIWPAVAAAFYFAVQLGVVVRILREKKPLGSSFLSLPSFLEFAADIFV